MLNALRQLAAFCLSISLCLGLLTPAASYADNLTAGDLAVIRRQAKAFMETEQRLPELASLVSEENWTFTRNLIHGPMQEVGREMLYINQRLDRSQRKEADKIARNLKQALAELDEAARLQDSARLQRSYGAVAAGFDAYSEVIPSEALS
jgi:photosystem II protein PsbQ